MAKQRAALYVRAEEIKKFLADLPPTVRFVAAAPHRFRKAFDSNEWTATRWTVIVEGEDSELPSSDLTS